LKPVVVEEVVVVDHHYQLDLVEVEIYLIMGDLVVVVDHQIDLAGPPDRWDLLAGPPPRALVVVVVDIAVLVILHQAQQGDLAV